MDLSLHKHNNYVERKWKLHVVATDANGEKENRGMDEEICCVCWLEDGVEGAGGDEEGGEGEDGPWREEVEVG